MRELERVIERAVALADSPSLQLDDLPPALLGGYADILLPSLAAKETMRAWGSRYARLGLERCRNNKRRACRELGIQTVELAATKSTVFGTTNRYSRETSPTFTVSAAKSPCFGSAASRLQTPAA